METFDVLRGNSRVGEATVRQDGLHTVIEAAAVRPDDGVYRLAAVCGGELRPLGVALPDGEVLRFKKKFTKLTLRELGYAEPSACALVLSGETLAASTGVQRIAQSVADAVPDIVHAAVGVVAPEPIAKLAEVVSSEIIDAVTEVFAPAPPVEVEVITEPSVTVFEPQKPEPEPEPTPDPAPVSEPVAPIIVTPITPEVSVVTPNELKSDPVTEIAPPALLGWSAIAEPRELFRESGLSAITGDMSGALTRRDDALVYLAAPIEEDAEFAMMPVFCFGTPEVIGGRGYLVFKLRDGVLTA
ncbi:MAG: hypothetical protein LBN02_10095 [Oscillospiraceae bacterium]|jgi:hypothetical protein|nr:hypothetical protein [Oscillospiraceae bacterium]